MTLTTRQQRTPRRPTEKQLDKAFAPLALEIGKLNRAWNMLHEHLGNLFAEIVNSDNVSIPLAVWYSTPSDRSQREMLRAAINALGALAGKKHPTAKEDIKWLLNQCDPLADRRNDALHAPLLVIAIPDSHKIIKILPHYFWGNPRALKLKDKNILDQVRWYRTMAETLRGYALSLWFHLGQQESWPQRPLMPTLGQDPTRKK